MSLAEESPQQTLVARYGAAVERLRAAMLAGQQHEFHAALAVLQEQRSDDMTQELRGLADALHDAMVQFRQDFHITAPEGGEAPDARAKLQYVLHLTDKAAHRTMDLVERCVPLIDRTISKAGDLAVRPASELSPQVSDFVTATWRDCSTVRGNLSQLMLEQSYQDLSGQIIRGVVVLVDQVELVLAKILGLTGIAGRTATYRVYRTAAGNAGNGAALAGLSGATVSQQRDVDDLMADLGI